MKRVDNLLYLKNDNGDGEIIQPIDMDQHELVLIRLIDHGKRKGHRHTELFFSDGVYGVDTESTKSEVMRCLPDSLWGMVPIEDTSKKIWYFRESFLEGELTYAMLNLSHKIRIPIKKGRWGELDIYDFMMESWLDSIKSWKTHDRWNTPDPTRISYSAGTEVPIGNIAAIVLKTMPNMTLSGRIIDIDFGKQEYGLKENQIWAVWEQLDDRLVYVGKRDSNMFFVNSDYIDLGLMDMNAGDMLDILNVKRELPLSARNGAVKFFDIPLDISRREIVECIKQHRPVARDSLVFLWDARLSAAETNIMSPNVSSLCNLSNKEHNLCYAMLSSPAGPYDCIVLPMSRDDAARCYPGMTEIPNNKTVMINRQAINWESTLSRTRFCNYYFSCKPLRVFSHNADSWVIEFLNTPDLRHALFALGGVDHVPDFRENNVLCINNLLEKQGRTSDLVCLITDSHGFHVWFSNKECDCEFFDNTEEGLTESMQEYLDLLLRTMNPQMFRLSNKTLYGTAYVSPGLLNLELMKMIAGRSQGITPLYSKAGWGLPRVEVRLEDIGKMEEIMRDESGR